MTWLCDLVTDLARQPDYPAPAVS